MRAMTECPVARNSRGQMLLLETSDVTDGMVELAVVVMTMNDGTLVFKGRARISACCEWPLYTLAHDPTRQQ